MSVFRCVNEEENKVKNILTLIFLLLSVFTFVSAQGIHIHSQNNDPKSTYEVTLLTPTKNSFNAVSLPQTSEIYNFDVPLGRTESNFIYANNGSLRYRGKNFSPTVTVNTSDVSRFKVSLLKSKNLAAAISVDGDGQNKLFLLNLSSFTSTPLQRQGMWNAAQEVFWSPSQKYMVALCAYEGERFIRIDLNTKQILEGDFLKKGNKVLSIKDNPRWIPNTDTLTFFVNETCNPYEDPNCTGDRINKVLAIYEIGIDAATLKLSFKPRSNKNIWVYNANPERTLQSKTFSELNDFIVVLTKIKQSESNPTFKYTVTVLGVNDTKNSNAELETVSLQVLMNKDIYIFLDSPRKLRNINRGGVGAYRNLIAEFSGTGKDPGWEDLSVASAKFEGEELAANRFIAGVGILFGLYTEFRLSPTKSEVVSKAVAVVDAIQYIAQLSNDLLSLTNQAPSVLPSAEFTNNLRDINQYKKLDFGATKLKKSVPLLNLLESVNAVRFEFIVNEVDGKEPSFFIKAKNVQNKVVGIEIGSNRALPKVLSAK